MITGTASPHGAGQPPTECERDFWLKTYIVARTNGENSATFCFADEVWPLQNLLRPHEINGAATVNFSQVREWLRVDSKRYVADLWLNTPVDANKVQGILVAIRFLGDMLPDFKGRPTDLRSQHARQVVQRLRDFNYSSSHNRHLQGTINKFMAFVRKQHPEGSINDFELILPKEMLENRRLTSAELKQKIVSTEVQSLILDACVSEIEAYWDAKKTYINQIENTAQYREEISRRRKAGESTALLPHRENEKPKMVHLFGRAVKATAVILANCVGRRAAAICNTKLDVRTERAEWTNEAGQVEEGVFVRFEEYKISNAYEDIFCPTAFGELAIYAIDTAKKLTEEIRKNNRQWADYLFLTPTKKRKTAKVLSPVQIRVFLNGDTRDPKGLLKRYEITSDHVTTHTFRRTRATKSWVGGMQIHEVAHDLGHVDGNTTERFYIIGDEEKQHRLRMLIDHGALRGAMVEFVGGNELVLTKLGKRHVQTLGEQGLIVSPTRYGYCALSGTGPCTRTNTCYLGPGVNDGGCDHHLLSPDAIDALKEDKETLEASIAAYEGDSTRRAWMVNQRNQLAVVDRNIELARSLQSGVGDCRGNDSCACKQPRLSGE